MMYVYGFLALIVVALGGAVYKYRGDAIQERAYAAQERARAETAIAANVENLKTITNLQEQNKRDNVVMAQVQSELSAINDSMQENTQAISDLEKSSEDVRNYLSGVVPPDVQRLLDK